MLNFTKLIRPPINISSANSYDLLAIVAFFIGGLWFLWNIPYWAGIVNMGNAQYGDAAFWWNGVLHFAEGIIKDNPNLNYRMGYALLAGLFVAIIGGSFFLFHKLLILFFLFVASFFYFSLKPRLGRIAATGAAALLIFSPFTAEWLAISSSDSTGLILNIAALSCLIFGVRNSLRLGFLAAFGFLLASASLTRPLMSPFIVPAIVILILYRSVSWKRRLQGMGSMLAAFAVPTFLWVIALHGMTGSWAMAGHDSTTFYAASDPQIQVWTGAMYEKVLDSAKNRYETPTPTAAQMNEEFWLLTKENYATNLNYHLSRITPHILDIAKFSNQDMSKNNVLWSLIKTAIMAILVVGFVISSALQRRWLGACLVGLIGFFITILPVNQSLVTFLPVSLVTFLSLIQPVIILGCAVLFSLNAFQLQRDRTYAILILYWWIGVIVLFLVGGTWGPPLGSVHAMNALGYRLGSQFFFINDLIIIAALGLISRLHMPSTLLQSYPLPKKDSIRLTDYLTKSMSESYAPLVLSLAAYIFISGVVIVGVTGASVISYRAWQRSHEVAQSFPPLGKLQSWWQENQSKLHIATPLEIASNISGLSSKIGSTVNGGTASPYILFTGGMSDFIWNLDGQTRSQAIIYLQANVSPLSMSPNLVYVEFPLHLHESEWVRKQGAWVVRRLPDLPLKSNLPFYFSETSVKAFVPLAKDGMQFDFSAAKIFPLQKYASQLYASSELKVNNGTFEWDYTSGVEKYPRRFSLKRDPIINPLEPVILELDISKAMGMRSLNFGLLWEKAPNSVQSTPASILKVLGESDFPEIQDKSMIYYTRDIGVAVAPQAVQSVRIDLTQAQHSKVKVVLDGVMSDDRVWFYEFNMQSDEFLR